MLKSWVSFQKFSENASSSLVSVDSRQGRTMINLGSDIATQKPLWFTPWGERLYFWYKGHLLSLKCTEKGSALLPHQKMTVYCIGRSSKILRELMDECRLQYLRLSQNKTAIFEHYNNSWKRTDTREIRPIDTVIMNETLKQSLLRDIQSFLDPEARSWYARRGLPHRRGYLLHGRPGTGKSSLSMAIAGCFGLDIYVLSLAALNDGQLSTLFRELPRRCVVLLEDIDAVGTTQSRVSDAGGFDSRSEDSQRPSKPKGTVSLSGLLNVLDGVASQEGRVLIMTTNHIDHLDEALIRSGRVDKKIEFQLADAEVVRKIFRTVFQQLKEELPDLEKRVDNNEEVRQLADQFAAQVPELEFSPADIFSFLLANRDSPSGALAEVERWVAFTREEKALRKGDSWVQGN
ncbi:mitochondrial chaperone bcs1 [Colletotrichum cereale]|nr:mitochondrial chaperone bcs1 [Colletotrichum cereale]